MLLQDRFLPGCSSWYLSGAGHLQAVHWAGDLDTLHLAVLAALVSDVLHYLLVLFVVQELFWCHHVHQTQHLSGHAAHLGDGAVQPWNLQRHWSLVYTRLEGQTEGFKDRSNGHTFICCFRLHHKCVNVNRHRGS